MTRHLRTLAAVAALVTVLAACGGSASPSPSASAGAASPSPAASTTPSPAASETPEPSVDRNGVPELEALLPEEIGGVALTRLSMTGEDFMALGTEVGRSQMRGMLTELGATVADLSIAEAHDPGGALVFRQGLFRVAGADPAQLLAVWVAAQQAAMQNRLAVTNVTVGGRDLTKLSDVTVEVAGTTYAFVEGDTLWLIMVDDQALLEEALSKVP